MAVIAVGDNCIDNYLSPINKQFCGGNAVNVAVWLRRGGLDTSYVGAVGDDTDFIREQLRREGVDVSHVQVIPGLTAVTDIVLENGERQFIREEFGVVAQHRIDTATLAFITQHELAYFSILGSDFSPLAALHEQGLKIAFDYSSADRQPAQFVTETLPYVDYAFFSMPDFDEARDLSRLRQQQLQYNTTLIATMGARGSLAVTAYGIHHQPAVEVAIVDTLGAGDTYIGIFLAKVIQGASIPEAMQAAAAQAAQTCTHFGAWEMAG